MDGADDEQCQRSQGYATHAAGAELLANRYEVGELEAYEVEIRISHCGICRSDLHLIDTDWQVSKFPFLPGHEIVGAVEAVGKAVQNIQPGARVGIGWQSGCCGNCRWCRSRKENLCPDSQPTCVHRNGEFADAMRVPARFVISIPEALDSENAAPLLCAGITVYTPLRTYGVSPASRVGVVGIGGLGHLALQSGRVFAAEVTAFSTSPAKEEEARALGAHHFCNTRESKGMKALAGSFDLIVSTVDADQDWSAFLTAAAGGRALPGRRSDSLAADFRLSVHPGSKNCQRQQHGQPLALAEMLDVAARHKVKAQTERFPMARVNEAVAKVREGAVRYRAVLAN
jgi:alcohol/geraniol dehydrogenase (NADP+)